MATVTVLSHPEWRRRGAPTEKARIVEESLAPGAVVTAVARRHDVHPNLLHLWRRQAKSVACVSRQIGFLPVSVAPPVGPASMAAGSIEIALGGEVRVRVDAAVDEAALGRVPRALGR
jgi:transposase